MKPILFSTPMVQAILDGRKTMTRRVVKPQPVTPDLEFARNRDDVDAAKLTEYEAKINANVKLNMIESGAAPHKIGDILYVRETWFQHYDGSYDYRATTTFDTKGWKPSIFMPKTAARIFLRVTDVRVERLQDITDLDAIKEGCEGTKCDCAHKTCGGGMVACTDCMNTGWLEPPKLDFMCLWDSLNAKPKAQYITVDGKKRIDHYVSYPFEDIRETKTHRGKPWHVIGNPWVWVYTFERCEKCPST